MNNDLAQAELKRQFSYDPLTGEFHRLVATSNSVKVGDLAGWRDGKGYLNIAINRVSYRSHRLVFLYMTGEFPPEHVDHINGCKSDNRWANLRHVTQTENQKNRPMPKNNTSGTVGVSWEKLTKKWVAIISIDNRKKRLGHFDKIEDAINARADAEIRYGYHPNHGRRVDGQTAQ